MRVHAVLCHAGMHRVVMVLFFNTLATVMEGRQQEMYKYRWQCTCKRNRELCPAIDC